MNAPPSQAPDLGSLLHTVARELRHAWLAQLAPYDLAPHQWRALSVLVRAGCGIRLGELAERLRIAARSATEVVDQLEAKELVVRKPDPADRRAVIISPTPSGLELHDNIRQRRREHSDQYFSTLSAAEQEQLALLLQRLTEH